MAGADGGGHGKTEPVILAETLRANGIEPTEEHQLRYAEVLPEQYRQHAEQLRQVGRALPGAAEALTALRQISGTVQTVLTGNYRGAAAVKLAAFDLDGALDLDSGGYADDDDRAALVPVAQRRAGGRYGHRFTQTNTVLIADTTSDVAAARSGGAAIIAVATGHNSADDLRAAGADSVLTALVDTATVLHAIDDIAGATGEAVS